MTTHVFAASRVCVQKTLALARLIGQRHHHRRRQMTTDGLRAGPTVDVRIRLSQTNRRRFLLSSWRRLCGCARLLRQLLALCLRDLRFGASGCGDAAAAAASSDHVADDTDERRTAAAGCSCITIFSFRCHGVFLCTHAS